MPHIPKPLEIYRHFRGNLYQVVTMAQHSETGEKLVIYQAMYGDFKTYARPLEMFLEKVDKEKYPEAIQEYRFELQTRETDQDSQAERSVDKAERSADKAERSADKTERGADTKRRPQAYEERTEAEQQLDPMVLEFLEADSYAKRLNILAGLRHRITNDMITTMAVASDIEIEDGDLEERYEALRNCLITLEKYECNRLR